jgi:hypothetical protein
MEFLTTRSPRSSASRRTLASRIAAAFMLVSAGSCMWLGSLVSRDHSLAFDHEQHVKGQGLSCINCHQNAKRADDPGMPALDQCMTCHEEIDADKPAEKHVDTLFRDDKFNARHADRLPAEAVFSHKRHTTADLDCGTCHTGIETNTRITADMHVSMDRCTQCHASRNVPAECATCHREIATNWPPESHHHNWKKMHGGVVREASDATADRCTLCHTESTCVACHKDEPPENHNNFWRLRGHGLAAMIDRQNCAACHEPDSCERCHRDAIPQNHMGLWSSTKATHCLACHTPLRDTGCAACHKDTPGHLQAQPKPPDHYPGQNCRQCHGVFAPLPHVDNGSDCNSCHF